MKTESKIDAKTPRSGGSLAEALKLSGAKRGREGEANGHAAKKGPAAAADSSSDDDDAESDDDDTVVAKASVTKESDDDSDDSDDDDDEEDSSDEPAFVFAVGEAVHCNWSDRGEYYLGAVEVANFDGT